MSRQQRVFRGLIACYVARPLVEYGIDAMCRCGAIGQQLLVLSLVVAAPLCCGCDHEMVLVGGYGKCGTSHLNSILASHPRIVSLTKDGMAQIPWLEWSEMLLHLRRVACSAHGQTKAMLRSCEKMFPMKQLVNHTGIEFFSPGVCLQSKRRSSCLPVK